MDRITQERRVHQRRRVRLPLVYEKGGRSFWSVTEDLSLGGAFLHSFHPPEEGERLHLRLKRPGCREDLSLTAKVVHRRPRNRAALPERGGPAPPSGVGVSFEEVTGRARARLEDLFECGAASTTSSRRLFAASIEEPEDLHAVRDPDSILKTLRCVCRKILPMHVRRLGGSILYSTYVRDVLFENGLPTVVADPVPLQDADRAFPAEVPFVFCFSHREKTWSFVVEENPARLAGGPFSLALPAELHFREERRQDRFGPELRPLLTVEFPDPLDPGLNRVKNVLDVSYGGLAFKSYPGEEVYTAGTLLEGMALYATDRACRVSDGVVKYAELVCAPSGEVYQRVGVAFSETGFPRLREVPAFREDEMEEMTRPEAILQHLKRVSQSGAKILTGRENCILFSDGVLHSEKRNGDLDFKVVSTHLARAPGALFQEGELSFHYLLYGIYHFFVAKTFRENGWLRLETPRKIYKAKRRRVLRVSCDGDLETRFRFFHPVLGQECVFPVRDLSIRGLAFDCDYVRHLLWKGFLLRDCKIELGRETLNIGPVEVRSLALRGEDPHGGGLGKTCGVEFFDLPVHVEKRISEYIFQKSNPHIVQVAVEKIENLWQLFLRSGFLYPGKADYLKRIKKEVDETWKKLLSGEADFFRQIAFLEGGQELGTASAVLAYEDCWLFQHLAATGHPVKLIPKYVILGLAQFLMEHREIRYLITYFRKENSFPWKIYSGFLEVYPLEEQLKFTRHHFLTRDLERDMPEQAPLELPVRFGGEGVVVERAAEADHEIVENCLRREMHPLLIRSRSLQRNTLDLPGISAAYRARGLVRERFCLVARDRGELAAFALVEHASPGVNLSGLLNTFSVWSVRRDTRVQEVRRKLIEVVAQFYRSLGARTAICLTQEEDLSDYLAAGFRKEKEYICFTSSRRAIKSYYDYVQERFSRFEERRERAGRELSF